MFLQHTLPLPLGLPSLFADEVVALELTIDCRSEGWLCVFFVLLVHLVEERDLIEVALGLADHIGYEWGFEFLRL